MKTISTIQRWGKIAKLIENNGAYSVRLFLNNGETLVNKYLDKSFKKSKTAIQKILLFINS